MSKGTQLAIISTTHTLATETTNNVYTFIVDTVNMVLGDELELIVEMKVLTAGAARVLYNAVYKDVQADPIKISTPIPAEFGAVFKLLQSAGTGRNFDWAVKSLP